MPSRYSFSDYSLEWPAAFEREADSLRALLGDDLVEVHHIGSTSVPGLAAKPIIDLLPVVREVASLDQRSDPVRDGASRLEPGRDASPGIQPVVGDL